MPKNRTKLPKIAPFCPLLFGFCLCLYFYGRGEDVLLRRRFFLSLFTAACETESVSGTVLASGSVYPSTTACKPSTLNFGNYYNFTSATAGTSLSITTANVTAPSSICPKPFKLPAYGDTASTPGSASLETLFSVYGLHWNGTPRNDYGIQRPPLSFLRSGYYYYSSGSLSGRGYSGSYWESRSDSATSAYYLYFNSSRLNPRYSSNRGYGRSIRCVLSP